MEEDGNGISVIYIRREKKSPTTLSIERLCVKLCLITIIILVGGRKKGRKNEQDIRSGYI